MRASTHIVAGRFCGGEIEPGTFHRGSPAGGTPPPGVTDADDVPAGAAASAAWRVREAPDAPR